VFYEYDLTVPKATAAAAPTELEVPLSAGKVVSVHIQFPPGCAGLVNVAIHRSNHQVWPGDLDSSIKGDGTIVGWIEDYDLADPPFGFTLRGWSPGSRYAHTISFRFGLLPLPAAAGPSPELGILERVAQFLGIG